MVKKMLGPASIMQLSGAEAYARNALKFGFTCETFSDGTPMTIFASVKITTNGEVSVCDFEVIRDQISGMEQDTAVLFPDSNSVDEGTVEGFCLADDDNRTQ